MTEPKNDTPVVHMTCRRGVDRSTHGQSCNGTLAWNITPTGVKYASFKCTTCNYEWIVPTGGQFYGV